RDTGALRHRDAIPETTMREQVVVLALVPRSIREQAVPQVIGQAGIAMHGSLGARVVAEQARRGEKRGVVPDLAIRRAFVVFRDQRPTRLDDAITNGLDETRIARR